MVKNLPTNARDAGDAGLIPGWGRSPGVGNGNPLQYSCLENPMDRGAWRATVHGGSQRVRHGLVTKHTQWLCRLLYDLIIGIHLPSVRMQYSHQMDIYIICLFFSFASEFVSFRENVVRLSHIDLQWLC